MRWWRSEPVGDLAREALGFERLTYSLSPWQSEVAESLDRLSESRLGREGWPRYRELARLPSLFAEGEALLDFVGALCFTRIGVLAVTDRRVLFVGHSVLLRRQKVVDFPLDRIDHVESQIRGTKALVRIYRPSMRRFEPPQEFHGIVPPSGALEVGKLIDQQLSLKRQS